MCFFVRDYRFKFRGEEYERRVPCSINKRVHNILVWCLALSIIQGLYIYFFVRDHSSNLEEKSMKEESIL